MNQTAHAMRQTADPTHTETRVCLAVSLTEEQAALLFDHLAGYTGARVARFNDDIAREAFDRDPDHNANDADPLDMLYMAICEGEFEEMALH